MMLSHVQQSKCVSIISQLKLEEKLRWGITVLYVLSLRKKKCMERDNRSWVGNWSCGILASIVIWRFWLFSFFYFSFIVFSWQETKSIFHWKVLCWQHDFWVHIEEEWGGQNGRNFRSKHELPHMGKRGRSKKNVFILVKFKIWCWPHHWRNFIVCVIAELYKVPN